MMAILHTSSIFAHVQKTFWRQAPPCLQCFPVFIAFQQARYLFHHAILTRHKTVHLLTARASVSAGPMASGGTQLQDAACGLYFLPQAIGLITIATHSANVHYACTVLTYAQCSQQMPAHHVTSCHDLLTVPYLGWRPSVTARVDQDAVQEPADASGLSHELASYGLSHEPDAAVCIIYISDTVQLAAHAAAC